MQQHKKAAVAGQWPLQEDLFLDRPVSILYCFIFLQSVVLPILSSLQTSARLLGCRSMLWSKIFLSHSFMSRGEASSISTGGQPELLEIEEGISSQSIRLESETAIAWHIVLNNSLTFPG